MTGRHLARLTSLMLLATALAGCGEESTPSPVDGHDFDGVDYSATQPYTGRVIDDYLKGARVWLDLDGDGQVTPGPLELTLDNGNVATLASGEPTALTGDGGRFSLDVSELDLPPEVGPDLRPEDYPLYALALPGQTVSQTRSGDVPVSRAFLLSASPGVTQVTPLSMVERYRRLAGVDSFQALATEGGDSLDGLNLLRDYVLANDAQAQAYARALARFAASQIPDEYNTLLSGSGADGTLRYLGKPAVFLLGLSLMKNAPAVIQVVDDAAAGDYANVDVDSLNLPSVPLELSDPSVLTEQIVYAASESGNLPANRSALTVSARLHFEYSEDGRLTSVASDGCMAPALPELARLIRVGGYPSKLTPQWLPSVSLSPQSKQVYGDGKLDERLTFDWTQQQAAFETVSGCHSSEGINSGLTDLLPEGSAEIFTQAPVLYTWTLSGGALAELNRQVRGEAGSTTILVPDADAVDVPPFAGYALSRDGNPLEALTFNGGAVSCGTAPDPDSTDQVATAQFPYTFTGYDQPSNFTGLAAEYDTRELTGDAGSANVSRLLRYGFLDPALSGLPNVAADSGFEWLFFYPRLLNPDHPNQILSAYLHDYTGPRDCGYGYGEPPFSAFAEVRYAYRALSDYLVDRLN
ncbi:hypothetical protein [Marinobacter sp. C2H3]|uniref:hypothetical protein n=1 Tax=Marinobacter sp. C2H3 TaxID=3119003 RepID=UPI00300EF56D